MSDDNKKAKEVVEHLFKIMGTRGYEDYTQEELENKKRRLENLKNSLITEADKKETQERIDEIDKYLKDI
jgi:hypothetical protein